MCGHSQSFRHCFPNTSIENNINLQLHCSEDLADIYYLAHIDQVFIPSEIRAKYKLTGYDVRQSDLKAFEAGYETYVEKL